MSACLHSAEAASWTHFYNETSRKKGARERTSTCEEIYFSILSFLLLVLPRVGNYIFILHFHCASLFLSVILRLTKVLFLFGKKLFAKNG